jgi:hypothetical protein
MFKSKAAWTRVKLPGQNRSNSTSMQMSISRRNLTLNSPSQRRVTLMTTHVGARPKSPRMDVNARFFGNLHFDHGQEDQGQAQ